MVGAKRRLFCIPPLSDAKQEVKEKKFLVRAAINIILIQDNL